MQSMRQTGNNIANIAVMHEDFNKMFFSVNSMKMAYFAEINNFLNSVFFVNF